MVTFWREGRSVTIPTTAQPDKPIALSLEPGNIPPEMKERKQWVLWRYKLVQNAQGEWKWTKVPHQPDGQKGKSNDAATWHTWESCVAAYHDGFAKFDGISFALAAGDPFTAIDLDRCADTLDDFIEPWANAIIGQFGSYTELSPSNSGIHILVKAKLPASGHNDQKNGVEVYDQGRFMTMTGHSVGDVPIMENQDALDALVKRYWPQDFDPPAPLVKHPIDYTQSPKHSDDEIIGLMANAANGNKVMGLWEGEFAGYASQSEADLALCNCIKFYTQSARQIDSLFRQSALYRPKWDEKHGSQTYGEMTIAKALEAVTETYRPPSRPERRREASESAKDARKDRAVTQLGNAERLVDKYGDLIRWVPQWGWLLFDGKRWHRVEEEEIEHLAKSVVRGIYREAGEQESEERRTETSKWAKTSEAKSQISAMVNLAKGDVIERVTQFDQHPFLLNVANGTLNLATLERQPHDPGDYFTRVSPVAYDPKATCPTWMQFLKRIFRSDPEIIGYLQTVVGYSLTGTTDEQMAVILYGLGSNGKTTFIETIMAMFGVGEFCEQTSFEVFLSKSNDSTSGPQPGLAKLKGARLVSASESDSGRKLNESLLKHVTGLATITARFLYRESFSFEPEFQLFLDTNNKPVIREQTYGMWRRIRLVPFMETISAEERIPDLGKKLRSEELPGILNWALEGYRIYCEQGGLQTPASVVQQTADYQSDEDPIGDFISAMCALEEGATVTPKDLREAYTTWCESTGEKPLTPGWFSRLLSQRGIVRSGRTNSNRGDYIGLRLSKGANEAHQ